MNTISVLVRLTAESLSFLELKANEIRAKNPNERQDDQDIEDKLVNAAIEFYAQANQNV